jgi:hypothetical protein
VHEEAKEELERIDRSARALVAHLKRLKSPILQLPLHDETCIWLITVERIHILENE